MRLHFLSNALFLCAAFVFLPVLSIAQSGLAPHGGVESLGHGRVFVCLPGLSGVFGNPAGLARLADFGAEIFLEERFHGAGLRESALGLGGRLGNTGVGFSLRQLGTEAYGERLLQVSGARRLGEALDFGLRFDAGWVGAESRGMQFLVNASLGMTAVISPRFTTGFYLQHPFRKDPLSASFLPATMGFGIRYLPAGQLRFMADILKVALQPAAIRAGFEYLPDPTVHIRAGISTAPSVFSLGVGFLIRSVYRVQMVTSHHPFLGLSPAFGLQYHRVEADKLSSGR